MTPSYIGDIEGDRRSPAQATLEKLSQLLGLNAEEAMCRAGRIGDEAQAYVNRTPEAVTLMRRVASANLNEDELRALVARVEKIQRAKS